ncbi:MAG: DUF58 domain-containing protein [Anaerolineales bacterium]|nr:DUF58 domain-containing protein [Anaerolineales bacterium]
MGRVSSVGLLAFGLLLAGLADVDGALLLLALPLLLYLAGGLLAGQRRMQVVVTRALSADRVPAQTPVVVTLTLRNEGAGIDELQVEDVLPEGLEVVEGETAVILALPAGAEAQLVYTVRGLRGAYQFRDVRLWAREHFGLAVQADVQRIERELFVLLRPGGRVLTDVDIRPRRTRVYAGSVRARSGGEGTDFFGVRRYAMGDSLRHINWKATARQRDTLFTNEFEQERVADVGLILDTRQASNAPGGHSLLEHSISAAIYLVDAFINRGNRVALLMYGDRLDYTLPGYGKVQRERILRDLSRARLGKSKVFEELRALPTRLFPAQSQIVFVSPLLEGDVAFLRRLRSYGYQVMLISPNPVLFEAQRLGEAAAVAFAARLVQQARQTQLQQARRAGIFVLDWDVTRPFDEVAGAQLRATWLTEPR